LDRTVPAGDGTTMKGLIQFDAAVNPGSSGGPLLNKAGQVVGIVTALANPSQQGFFIGIGFAVPIGAASGAAGGPDLCATSGTYAWTPPAPAPSPWSTSCTR